MVRFVGHGLILILMVRWCFTLPGLAFIQSADLLNPAGPSRTTALNSLLRCRTAANCGAIAVVGLLVYVLSLLSQLVRANADYYEPIHKVN